MHCFFFKSWVYGEEQTLARAAEWVEDRDWKSEAEGEGDSSGHHSQSEYRTGHQ